MLSNYAKMDCLQFVQKRLDQGRMFSFRQWGSEMEVWVLSQIGAETIDWIEGCETHPTRQVIRIGRTLFTQVGDEDFRWMPMRDSWLRLQPAPVDSDTYSFVSGIEGRLLFEADGRFIWMLEEALYKPEMVAGKLKLLAQWDDLSGDPVQWAEANVSTDMVESVSTEVRNG